MRRRLASLAGGAVHGFFADSRGLWRFVLIALGVVSASAWAIGARMLLTDRVARFRHRCRARGTRGLFAAGRVVTDSFSIAIANYLPSTLF